MLCFTLRVLFFFFNDTATTEIYTLSLHDALPISRTISLTFPRPPSRKSRHKDSLALEVRDRKSTRLNSSHQIISYAVFCLKKKKAQQLARILPAVVAFTSTTDLLVKSITRLPCVY